MRFKQKILPSVDKVYLIINLMQESWVKTHNILQYNNDFIVSLQI